MFVMMTAHCKKKEKKKGINLVCKDLGALMIYNYRRLYPASNLCFCVEPPLHQRCRCVRHLCRTLYTVVYLHTFTAGAHC